MTADAGDLAFPYTAEQRLAGVAAHPVRAFNWAGNLGEQPWETVAPEHVIKTAAFIPVSREVLRDWGWLPWESPNRNPMPHIVLFPRLAHTFASVERARQRVRDAYGVLLHGLPEPAVDDAW